MMTGELLDSLSFICYVTQYWLWNTNFCDHGGNLRSHGCQMTFNWYLIHQDGPYLSFDMSHDICGEFLLVHWRSYGGQMTAKLSEMLTSELLKSLSFIWYVTWYWLETFLSWKLSEEVTFSVKWLSKDIWYTYADELLKPLPFVWYITWYMAAKMVWLMNENV